MPDPFNYSLIEAPWLYAGSEPTSESDLQSLYDLGIRTILNFSDRVSPLPDISKFRVFNSLIRTDQGIEVPADAQLDQALKIMVDAQSSQTPLYVHCYSGLNRTGIILFAYYVQIRHFDWDSAMAQLGKRTNHQGKHAEPGSAVQRDWCKRIYDSSEHNHA